MQDFRLLILPNGKHPTDMSLTMKSYQYIDRNFGLVKVKGVSVCTDYFITSPPQEGEKAKRTPTESLSKEKQVFIVHGRDEKQALQLQKFLTRNLKIGAEMFEDFKEENSGDTIIELLEYIKENVGYAFVIVTPDDLGCLHEDIKKCRTKFLVGTKKVEVQTVCGILDKLNTRARQNVVFEQGLFIGALGRDKVCCLLQNDTKEKPSDIDGILYVGFSKSVRETFVEITKKLKNAGIVKA